MKFSDLANNDDYLGLPEIERSKVVEHLAKGDNDFKGLPEAEQIKVLNHVVGLKAKTATQAAPAQTAQPQEDEPGMVTQLGKGALAGAADIGNTLINASTYVPRKIAGLASSAMGKDNEIEAANNEREASLEGFNQENKNSIPFQVGRFGTNLAGTAAVGPVVGGTLKLASQTPKALALAESIASSGTKGTLVNKVAGGATAGAGSTLLIDPKSVPEGAGVGAAIPIAGKGLGIAGNRVAEAVGELGTHTGGESIKTAARSGAQGGKNAKSFVDNMRGNVPIEDVLADAKSNLQVMQQAKSAEYRNGIQQVSKDKTVLDFNGIDKALQDASQIGSYKGQNINKKAGDALKDIKEAIDDWKKLDPKEFHTPEGLDALKKKISGIQESIPFEEKTARTAAGKVYNSIKSEISTQAPEYAKVMKNYSEAADQIQEIEKALSLGNKASADTAMRKLQSLTRNNANTNYGNRLKLAKDLEAQGGKEIMPALSGQALNSVAPRGLGKVVAGATGLASVTNPALLAALAVQSPRLAGEAAYKIGQGSRGISNAIRNTTPAGAIAAAINRD